MVTGTHFVLLIIDMQKAYFTHDSKESMEKAVKHIHYAIDLFRKNNLEIIWIYHEDKEDGCVRGTEGFEIIDLLQPKDHEKRIVKHYWNSFNRTGLLRYLSHKKIDTILITGYCAEYCVLSTYRGALDYDLTPKIVQNAIAGGNNENIKFVENISELITIEELEKIIKMEVKNWKETV